MTKKSRDRRKARRKGPLKFTFKITHFMPKNFNSIRFAPATKEAYDGSETSYFDIDERLIW